MILEQLTQMQNKVAQCTVSCMDVYLCGMLITTDKLRAVIEIAMKQNSGNDNILI